jgi:hypothetical protein
VNSSNIWDNHTSNDGGGIYNISDSLSDSLPVDYLGLVTVSSSTISDNTAGIAGGGIYNSNSHFEKNRVLTPILEFKI